MSNTAPSRIASTSEKLKILVVDDDPGHLVTLKTIVKSWGYRVETADDGTRAVAAVRESAYDLILMDVRMAEMDGIEALKLIKDYNPAIPILIMTAYSSVETAVDALKSGAYDYLTKPFEMMELMARVEAVLRRSQPGGGTQSAVYEFGDLTVDVDRHEATKSGNRTIVDCE